MPVVHIAFNHVFAGDELARDLSMVRLTTGESGSSYKRLWTAGSGTSTVMTTTPVGRQVEYTLDSLERPTTIAIQGSDPVPIDSIGITYGTSGNGAGKITQVTQGARMTTLNYGANGFVSSIVTPLSTSATITYNTRDNDGRVTQATLLNSRQLNMQYDPNGNMTLFEEPNGSHYEHNFAYNVLNTLGTYEPPPPSGTTGYWNTNYDYDGDGLLLDTIPPVASAVGYTHDGAGRVTQVSYNHPVSGTVLVTTNYDTSTSGAIGHPCTAAAGSCSATNGPDPESVATTDTYDGMLLTSETTHVTSPLSFSHTVYWSHDSSLRVIARSIDATMTETVPCTSSSSSTCALFGYVEGTGSASDGLLSTVQAGGGTYTVKRGTTGLIDCASAVSGSNGTCDVYGYNPYGEVTSYAVYPGGCTGLPTSCGYSGTPLYSVTYVRDTNATGRITSKTEAYGTTTLCTHNYQYDPSHTDTFLTSVTLTGSGGCSGTTTYNYDLDGNDTSLTYDDQDRIMTGGGWTWYYAADGSLTSQTTGSTTVTYNYDPLGNLRHFSYPNYGTTWDYLVDAQNRRTYRLSTGSTQTVPTADSRGWIYDGDRIIGEVTSGSGNAVQTHFIYVTKPNVPDVMLHNDGTVTSPNWQLYRIVSDVIGSVRAVIKVSNATVEENYSTYAYYDDFGALSNGSAYQPFGFAGGLNEAYPGLVHFGARDYTGWQRRWVSKDPIRQDGGLNLYQYCDSDPVNCEDSDGLSGEFGSGAGSAIEREINPRPSAVYDPPEACEEYRKIIFLACTKALHRVGVPAKEGVIACITISYIAKALCEDQDPTPNACMNTDDKGASVLPGF